MCSVPRGNGLLKKVDILGIDEGQSFGGGNGEGNPPSSTITWPSSILLAMRRDFNVFSCRIHHYGGRFGIIG